MSQPPPMPTKVLVIDDSATVLRVMDFVLSQAGYEVTCLERGHDVVDVARRVRPELIFVDFNMPEVNGFDVCRALGEDPELEGIPIVIMSTRGDVVGDRFVRDMGIVDHITKPFAPEALLAVVQHTLRKVQGIDPLARRRHTFQSFDPRPAEATEAHPGPGETLAREFVAALGGLLPDERGEAAVTERFMALFSGDALDAPMRALLRTHASGPALEGDLSKVSIAEVFQLLALQRQSGILTVEHHGRMVSVALKDGAVRLVTSENLSKEFLLGTLLVREKLMEARELDLLVQNRKGTRRMLGSQVVKLGYVSQQDLARVLRQQSSELVYEILRWGGGRFEFHKRDELPEQVLEFDFGITIDELLMEGFRRVDEWGLIESVLPSFDLVPTRVTGGIEHVGPDGLTREEKSVYELVDGTRTVGQIVDAASMATFEVARVLYRLVSARVIAVPT